MKHIKTALISCYHKEAMLPLAQRLVTHHVQLYSTGGTADYLKQNAIPCTTIEEITGYPSILGGRVKTLHPSVMGGILSRAHHPKDEQELAHYRIPKIDLVIVDLYPFLETVKGNATEQECVEKIDIGGVSLIRAAAKNFSDCAVLCSPEHYEQMNHLIAEQGCGSSLQQRKQFATEAFQLVAQYDLEIAHYFNQELLEIHSERAHLPLRYGENPHQSATFYGELQKQFTQIQGKELSYNNLLDIDVAIQMLSDVQDEKEVCWGIIKHNNVCGIALHPSSTLAWERALQGDAESAFGGILFTQHTVDEPTAALIHQLFFEVLIAKEIDEKALALLSKKKNRILLKWHPQPTPKMEYRSVLGGMLVQEKNVARHLAWEQVSGTPLSPSIEKDLLFANMICKHLKSNAISLVKNQQLVGKGCGQTSRIDAMKHAIAKAKQFGNDLQGSVLASDAFFPFDDCVRIAHQEGIQAFIQPGGSIRDADSIQYCQQHSLAMILTRTRHFKH